MRITAEQLEQHIDASEDGFIHLLTALECVMSEKADHIRANWQDHSTARVYDKWSKRFLALAIDAQADGL